MMDENKQTNGGGCGSSGCSESGGGIKNQSSANRTILMKFRLFAASHPTLTFLAMMSLIIVPIREIVIPQLTGRVIDSVRTKTGRAGTMRAVWWVILVLAVVQVMYMFDDHVESWLHPAMQNFFSEEMLASVLNNNETNAATNHNTGDVMAQFVKLPATLTDWLETIKQIIPHLLTHVLSIGYFVYIDLPLGVGMACLVLALFCVMYITTHTCSSISCARDVSQNEIQVHVDEVLHNLPAVYATDMQASELDTLRNVQETYRDLYLRSSSCSMILKAIMVPLTLLAIAGAMYRCNALVNKGKLSVGTFASVFMVIMYLQTSLLRMIVYYRVLLFQWGVLLSGAHVLQSSSDQSNQTHARGTNGENRGKIEGERENANNEDEEEEEDETGSKRRNQRSSPLIRLNGGVRYNRVRIPDFQLRDGERVAVVGPVGCGKSTLLALLMRFVLPTEGKMYLFGKPYEEYAVADIRRVFGYIPQSTVLFDRSIMENITYGLKLSEKISVTDKKVWMCAARLGLTERLRNMHGGNLKSKVGKAGAALSGGQRQVVWLLRMALRSPRILLLDEPTSALDDDTATEVARAISTFPCVVMVTHDDRLIKQSSTRVFRFPYPHRTT
jgi:ABC-type multidrug transport system fused ATPase/permease subunit